MALGRVTIDTVEGLDREFEGPFLCFGAAEGEGELVRDHGAQLLHGAFAEGRLVAHDDGATVVLQGGGENLRCRGARSIHEDDEGTAVNGFTIP